jgi:hypothetical protein|tara:strand:- start:1839 stop:2003 length:165 start_codon:yes stop_codon:yes gene_type:complete
LKDIVSANLAGDTKAIWVFAMKIKYSFKLTQNLTLSQNHELHTKLPSDYGAKSI